MYSKRICEVTDRGDSARRIYFIDKEIGMYLCTTK